MLYPSSTTFAELPSGDALGAELVALVECEKERAARKAVQARARAERASARAAARAIPPEVDGAYAHLALSELRAARQLVAEEEERLGYWQRILATRQDALRGEGSDLDMERLRPALSAGRMHSARSAIGRVCGTALPALPDLGLLWVDPDAGDADAILTDVAGGLAAYRDALASRLKSITQELIARYRMSPADCLALLPPDSAGHSVTSMRPGRMLTAC